MNADTAIQSTPPEGASAAQAFDAIVIGAGFAGLYMLVRLRAIGLRARAAAYAMGSDGPYCYYYRSLFAKLKRRGALGVFKTDPKQSDDSVTLFDVMDKLVIHGSPARVLGQLQAFRQQTGDFGTLLYAGVDWKDRERARNSMRLMAEQVMPALNA
jgi:alkanesulfonate monooxygenase SsuD/methylene tetrahydromethanopterin reductase-like flavin-dependent oxidoreductase (luciferase family)